MVTADDRAIQEQDGNIESMATLQDRVTVDIDYVDRRQGQRAIQRLQLPQHLVTQLTVVPVHDCQTWRIGAHQ